jgi:hypothetical protein
MHEYGNWKTEHYKSVLEIQFQGVTVSFLGKHIGTRHLYWILTASSALHLQCRAKTLSNQPGAYK